MENNNLDLSKKAITNILTLRYNIDSKLSLPRLNWKDFQQIHDDYSLEFLEKTIICALREKLGENPKNVSVSLSAGIDSTLVLAILKKNFPEFGINSFSMKFSESIDETTQASKIAEFFEVEHNVITLENFLIDLPRAISITKQPFWDLHWYHIAKHGKLFSDYLVSGDGGDELFGGYTFRYKKFSSLISKNPDWKEKVKLYLECHERDWVPDQDEIFSSEIHFSWDEIYDHLRPFFDNSLSNIDQIFLADYNGKLLCNFNPINTSLNNFFKIFSVTPLLSSEIISFASHLNSNVKVDQRYDVGKIPLRKLLEKYVDVDLINVKKQGFSVNTKNLWKNYGYKICEKYLVNANICKNKLINKKWIEKHLKEDLDDIRYINKFLGLLAYEIWYRIFVTKEMNHETKLEV